MFKNTGLRFLVVFMGVGGRAGAEKRLDRSELGDSLGALRDGVLGQLSGEDQADGSLDLAGGHSGLLVVQGQAGGLRRHLVEDVVDEGVHDAHGLQTT